MKYRASAVILTLALVLACDKQATTDAPSGGSGRSLDISLPSVDGEVVDVTAETGDEVFVLVFWATWCQPCQQELTKLTDVYNERFDRGLRIYAISIDAPDTAAQVAPWVQREGYPFPVLLDRETQVLVRYNPRGEIPYYVVLDANGQMLKEHQGYVPGDEVHLAEFLDGVLKPG